MVLRSIPAFDLFGLLFHSIDFILLAPENNTCKWCYALLFLFFNRSTNYCVNYCLTISPERFIVDNVNFDKRRRHAITRIRVKRDPERKGYPCT